MRAVMKESGKWRSGREAVRTGRTKPSGRGGKTPHAFAQNECVAAQDTRHVMVPARVTASFIVVEAKLAFEVFVQSFGAITLFDDSYQSFSRGFARQRSEEELRRFGLVTRPLDEQPDVFANRRVPAVVVKGNHAQH